MKIIILQYAHTQMLFAMITKGIVEQYYQAHDANAMS